MKFKKVICLVTVFSLLSLSACGKKVEDTAIKDNSKTTNNKSSETVLDADYKDYVYKGEKVSEGDFDVSYVPYKDGFYNLRVGYTEIGEDLEDEENVAFVEDDKESEEKVTKEETLDSENNEEVKDTVIYGGDEDFYEDGDVSDYMVSFDVDFYDKDLKLLDTVSFEGLESVYGSFSFVDDERNLYFTCLDYSEDEEHPKVLVHKVNDKGEDVSVAEYDTDSEYYVYLEKFFDLDGDIYVQDGSGNISLLNEDGTSFKNVYSYSGDGYIECFDVDNKLVVTESDYTTNPKVGTLDIDKGIISYFDITFETKNPSFRAGSNSKLLVTDDSYVYLLDVNEGTLTKALDFIQSDINCNGYDSVLLVDDFFYFTFFEDEGTSIWKFTKVDPKDVKDKTIVTIAGYYVPYDLRQKAVEFNRASADTRLVIKDYGVNDDYSGEEAISGMNTLDKEVITGNVPDILVLDDYDMILKYAKKGLFADLNSYMGTNNFPSKDEFQENILSLVNFDDKTYILPTNYSVRTYVMKKALLDKINPYTKENIDKFINEKGIDESDFYGSMLKDYALNLILTGSGDTFVDFKNGKANLNSKEFIDMLKFVNTLKTSDEVYGDNYEYEDTSSYYRDDRYILSSLYISNLDSYMYSRYGTFGEEIAVAGIPGCENVISVYPENMFAISAASSNKDAAIKFISEFFTEENQATAAEYSFPITKKALENKFEKEKKGDFWIDEDGKEIFYENTYYLNDVEIKIPDVSDEDIDFVRNILANVNAVEGFDEDLIKIITEEADSYFSGAKSAEDVAEVMQSRVSIFLSERN